MYQTEEHKKKVITWLQSNSRFFNTTPQSAVYTKYLEDFGEQAEFETMAAFGRFLGSQGIKRTSYRDKRTNKIFKAYTIDIKGTVVNDQLEYLPHGIPKRTKAICEACKGQGWIYKLKEETTKTY